MLHDNYSLVETSEQIDIILHGCLCTHPCLHRYVCVFRWAIGIFSTESRCKRNTQKLTNYKQGLKKKFHQPRQMTNFRCGGRQRYSVSQGGDVTFFSPGFLIGYPTWFSFERINKIQTIYFVSLFTDPQLC